jgi:hypothetical protein
MKLELKKEELKKLSLDEKVLPKELTDKVGGASPGTSMCASNYICHTDLCQVQ